MSTNSPNGSPKVRPHLRGPFVPVPHSAFDVLPSLTGAEAKVLFVVIRQTLGWTGQGTDGRKERDWISQSQFKEKAGLSGEAVSRAIDALVRRELIAASDKEKVSLDTPAARRRVQSRVYYEPGQKLATCSEKGPLEEARRKKTSVRKSDTTKETRDKRDKREWVSGDVTVYATDSLGFRRRIDFGGMDERTKTMLVEAARNPIHLHGSERSPI